MSVAGIGAGGLKRTWGQTLLRAWELVLSILGIVSVCYAPFTCCLFFFFLGVGLGLLWLAFLPRLLAGAPGGLEHLRVLLIASYPICAGLFGVWEGGKRLSTASYMVVSPEWAWTGTIVLVSLLLAALLRSWLAGRLAPSDLPWRRPPSDGPTPWPR